MANPSTMRLYTSMTTVKDGRWIGWRCSSSTTMTSMGVWSIWATASGQSAPGKCPLRGSYFSAARFLPSRFYSLRRSERTETLARIVFWSGLSFNLAVEALQIYFFDDRCYIRPFRCQIDLLDGGIDDLLDFVGKSSCTSIRALFA